MRHERTVIAVYIGGKSSLPPRISHTLARESSNRLADRNIPRRFVFDLS